MLLRSRSRLVVGILGALAILYAQQFLSIHEPKHLFEADASHCQYAALASVGSSGMLPSVAALPVPVAAPQDHQPFTQSLASSPKPAPQARGPPAA
jgi:hypothetical protein